MLWEHYIFLICIKIICIRHALQEKNLRIEAMLNKHTNIYPELYPES